MDAPALSVAARPIPRERGLPGAALRRALACVAVLAGCAGPSATETDPLPMADAAYYEAHVQVVVGYGCGSLDCHGDPGRPLRLYARDGLRLRAELRGEELTAEEAALNAQAFLGIDPAPSAIDAHVALLKPLAEAAGGLPHVGGDVWESRDDDAYRCVYGWLAGAPDDARCAAASAAVDPR